MRSSPAGADEFVPDGSREREIGQGVAVHVAELDPANPELDTAEPVGEHAHARPAAHLAAHSLAGSLGHLPEELGDPSHGDMSWK